MSTFVSETRSAVPFTPAQRLERRIAWATVVLPAVGCAAAGVLAALQGVRAVDLGLCASMYVLTMFGITAGYHRHFTHLGYQARPPVRWCLGVLGAMAAQGPLLYWVAAHRRHHQHADRPGDPHSPWEAPGGFWHAHLTWLLAPTTEDWVRVVPDLLKDKLAFAVHRYYFAAVAAGLALPSLLGGAISQSMDGALMGGLWGGLVRIFLVHHATWLVNSWCHRWGARAHDTADRSTNSSLCALLTLGEGWHNNHHAAPAAVRHGRSWWQWDVTYWGVWMLARLRLASHLVEAGAAGPREGQRHDG